jgi:cation:H+ antiporter
MLTLLLLLLGLALLYAGGEWLVSGAVALASRFGISPLAIGLTVVAFGTSMPELVVSLDAAIAGANDISLGNVVGSNIANITLILGLAALIAPTTCGPRIVRVDGPVMIGVSLVMLAAMANGYLSRLEGALFFVGIIGFTVFTLWQATRPDTAGTPAAPEDADLAANRPLKMGLQVGAGLGLLILGGHLVVNSAVEIATLLGMSQAFIGLTVVAVGTSLPELSTSVIAALRRQGDIAIGNVVGSNIFNILGILGVTAMVAPLQLGGLTWLDLWLMVLAAVILIGLLWLRHQLSKAEGTLLLTLYIAYTAWLIAG